jgi:hypothetical protein
LAPEPAPSSVEILRMQTFWLNLGEGGGNVFIITFCVNFHYLWPNINWLITLLTKF